MILPGSWQAADGLVLEPNARHAATSRATSLVVTAGPGAGKTELLAQRADFLLFVVVQDVTHAGSGTCVPRPRQRLGRVS